MEKVLHRWAKSLLRSSFVRNVVVLAGGRGAALIVALLLTPIIARLFTPADFGVVAVLFAVSQMIGDISTLNYQRAVLLPKTVEKSGEVLFLSKAVLLLVVSLLLAFLGVLKLTGVEIPYSSMLGGWVWAVPLVVGIIGMGHVRCMTLTRSKEYGVIARADIGQALTTTGSRIGLGMLFGSSVWGLASGYLLGLAVRLGMLQGHNDIYNRVSATKAQWHRLTTVAREYKDLPLLNMPSELMISISTKLPLLTLGVWLGSSVVGFYAMASRLVKGPLDTVSVALRRVYLQRAAELEADGRGIHGIFLKTTITLFILGVAPFGILWLFGEEILGFVLGEAWREAGRYVEILAPWLFAVWTSAVVSPTLVVRRKQGIWLVLQTVVFSFRAVVLGWCYLIEASVDYTLVLFVWVNIALAFVTMTIGFALSSDDRLTIK